MAEQYKFTPTLAQEFEYQTYDVQDTNLISSNIELSSFDSFSNYVESHLYDSNNNLLASNYNEGYSILDNNLTINLTSSFVDLAILGSPTIFDNEIESTFYLNYNILSNLLSSSIDFSYFISEISSDRTEIRFDTNNISNIDVVNSSLALSNIINTSPTQFDFYLNFGGDTLIIANNVLLDNSDENNPTILIKLYEALPQQFNLKDECWVVQKIAASVSYKLDYKNYIDDILTQGIQLQGPNYNISYKDQINNSTDYITYSSLTTSQTSSLQYQLNNVLNQKGVSINVDYTDYSNFIKFSSAYERLANFYYKVTLLEEYQYSASLSFNTSSFYASSSNAIWENKIDNIISNFDGYENYLYQASSSYAWPKQNSEPPYILYDSTSSEATDWLTTQLLSGSSYDTGNRDNLFKSIPLYLQEDPSNAPLGLFVNMLGQHYDNLYLYIKDVSNKFNADNRINYGVSKDLVADIIKDFGLKIYQNNFSTNDLYSAFFGYNTSGSYSLPTNATGGLDVTPNSFVEYITNYVTSSNDALPLDDMQKRVYKRIYHSLPYIIKRKGTLKGLEALSNIYGIPNTILRYSEFGGKDRINVNDWDLWQNKFNYKFDTEASGFISSSWIINNSWSSTTPSTVQFRFKTPDLDSAISTPSQSLWKLDTNVELYLTYTGSGYTSGSYSGSIPDPYNKYANLVLSVDGTTSSVYLPFFDTNWWSVMATLNSNVVTLYAGNKIYSGSDGSQLGFYASQSVSGVDDTEWINGTISYFASASVYSKFSGSLQEIRYFDVSISESVFKDYIMNPQSIEGNETNTSPDQLVFRASLGGELYTGSNSIHPKVTGSWTTTSSFNGGNSFYISGSFSNNTEYFFSDQPVVGIKNRISDKISPESLVLPSGNTLSKYISIQQTPYISSSYTADINYLEAAFSPQNEINDDIVSSIGYFDVSEYIGDPRFASSSLNYYPLLNTLRDNYFLKYKNNYDVYDYIRLIKYFDNSLFKMINDYIPARTSLASGIVVKQHLLERNRYRAPLTTFSQPEYTGSIGQTATLVNGAREYTPTNQFESIPLETITGSNGGAILTSDITQSWAGIYDTPVGQLSFTHDDESEFINGEFSGSDIVTTTGELNTGCDPYKKEPTTPVVYDVRSQNSGGPYYSFNPNSGANFTDPSGGDATNLDTFSNGLNQAAGRVNLWWNATRTLFSVDPSALSPYPPGDYAQDTYKVNFVTINKTDKNGLDLTTYIPSLTVLEISLYAPTATINTSYTPGTYYTLNTLGGSGLLRLLITSISERANYYILEVTQLDGRYFDLISTRGPGSAPAPYPLKITNTSNKEVIFSPFVPLTFAGSDCNVIYGNETEARLSDKFYDLDYSSNAIQAVNQQVVISASQQSGSATFAPVQDYNYYTKRSTLPRYIGSENTASNYNSTSSGFAPIDYTDPIILEFNWGGGTYPEIYGGGALNLNQALLIGSDENQVNKFGNQQIGFIDTVKTAFPPNFTPTFKQYTTTTTTVNGAKVIGYNFSVPEQSTYFLPSAGVHTATIAAGRSYIALQNQVYNVGKNSSGYYATGSGATPNTSASIAISNSLANEDRWFITLYETLPNPVQGALIPIASGSVVDYTIQVSGAYMDPLTKNGVYEIISVDSTNSYLYLNPYLPQGPSIGSIGGSASNLGMLIWKAVKGSYILFNDATLSGLGKGGLLTSTPSTTTENSFTYITQNFGNNPKNQ